MGMSISWITDSVVGQVPIVPPDTPAVALGNDEPITYGQLRERELEFARALMARGVQKGDRVALLLRNSTDYIAWFLAVGRVGAICVRLNWRLTAAELGFQITDSGSTTLIFDDEFSETVSSTRDPEVSCVYVSCGAEAVPEWAQSLEAFLSHQSDRRFPVVSLEDPLTLMYSSGTTGQPKGAVLTHGNLLWIGANQRMSWGIDEDAVGLNMGPLFHAGGFEVVTLPTLLAHGLAVTYPSGGFTLDGLLATARRHNATIMLAYSFVLYEFAQYDDLRERVPESLRRIITGGDTILPWAYDAFELQVPFVNVTQSYSLTEGGAVAIFLDHQLARGRESSIGRPQPMTEVRILDQSGEPVATGAVGEIWLRSPGVSVGYWNRPEASAEVFIDGWCKTGDLGRVDDSGFVTLAGREKDMIRSGGENIYPAEIERVLADHAEVHDVAIVGVPDERYVEVGCAVVVLEKGSTVAAEQLREYLSAHIAKYKLPKHYVFVEALPRNAGGKVLKRQLREEYAHLGCNAPGIASVN